MNPLAEYKIADKDEGTTSYYGYVTISGRWYILKDTATTDRYCRGLPGGYADAWANRATNTYAYLYEVF